MIDNKNLIIFLGSVGCLLIGFISLAHEGHTHSDQKISEASAQAYESLSGEGKLFEVVLSKGKEGKINVLASDMMTNMPLAQATISVRVTGQNPWKGEATPTAQGGVYELSLDKFIPDSTWVITIQHKGNSEDITISPAKS